MQLPLFKNLPVDQSYDIQDFINSPANKEAVLWVNKWPEIIYNSYITTVPITNAIMLYGPPKCGKTHLAKYWQQRLNAHCVNAKDLDGEEVAQKVLNEKRNIVLEGCHEINDEQSLFHLFNAVKEAKVALLMTSRQAIECQNIGLADLRSRLNTVPSIEISQPDQELVYMLILRYSTMHQLNIEARVVEYLTMHIEWSYQAIERTLERLNKEALEKNRKITIPFIKAINLL